MAFMRTSTPSNNFPTSSNSTRSKDLHSMKPSHFSNKEDFVKSEGFFNTQSGQQQLLLAQQDRTLDDLAIAAEKLNQNATVINVELQDQQRMLDDLDTDVERETEHMNFVMRRMAKVFQTSSRRQLCLILWLTAIFFILLLLVLM